MSHGRHLRGRVFPMKRIEGPNESFLIYGMEVVNTHTGKVIASDNGRGLAKMTDLCDEAVTAARLAWFWGYSKRDVRE